MLIAIWIILIFLGLVKKQSKRVTCLQILFIVILLATAKDIADQWSYVNTFESLHAGTKSIFDGNVLFNFLLYLFGVFGNYTVALVGLGSFCMVLIYKGVSFYTKNTALVFSLYLIAPFVIDAAQIKNLVAMAIWVFFSKYLYLAMQEQKWGRNASLYVMGVVLATGVHFSFIFTMIFILAVFMDIKKIIIIVGIFLVLGFSATAEIYVENLMNIFSKVDFSYLRLLSQKYGDYVSNYNFGSSNSRMLITLVFFVFFILNAIVFSIIYSNQIEKRVLNVFITKLNIISALLFPLMFYSQEMYRVQRNLLVMDYILIASFVDKPILRDKKLNVVRGYVVIVGFVFAGYYLMADSIIWNKADVFDVLFKL